MRIAIVDDEQKDREEMAALAAGVCGALNVPCDVYPFTSGDAFLQKFAPGLYDVVLLDIYMEGANGMETAWAIRQSDKQVRLVFVTMTDQFAVEGFEVQATHYLVKPATAGQMEKALRACLSRKSLDERYITVKEGYYEHDVLMQNILYTICERNVVVLYTTRGQMRVYSSYKKFAPLLLCDARFVQCGYGVLLNLEHVNRLEEREFILDGGHAVPVPRRERERLRVAWAGYEAAQQEERWAKTTE